MKSKHILLCLLLFVATAGHTQTQIIVGDMNRDGEINVSDVTALVSVILGNSPIQYITRDDFGTPVTGITLAPSSLALKAGGTATLTATVTPADAAEKGVAWASSNPAVATVSEGGVVTAVSAGTATIIASTVDGGFTAICSVTVIPGYVEMAPGFYWATCNIGADNPWDYGHYFAWGEIQPKTDYSWSNYKYGTENNLTKYNATDGESVLLSVDDVATADRGAGWHMPTSGDWARLRDSESFTWESVTNYEGTGVAGCIVTSKVEGCVGNQIFLPAAGAYSGATLYSEGTMCYYWSSSVTTDMFGQPTANAEAAYVRTDANPDLTVSGMGRFNGLSVRPMLTPIQVTGVTLNMTSLTIELGKSDALTATVSPDNATINNVIWTSSDESVVTVSQNGVVTGINRGTATITATTEDGGYTATCEIKVATLINGYEYVEMGDGLKWATMNVGASSPEDYGDFFAWAEIDPKGNYSWSTYKYSTSDEVHITRYQVEDGYNNLYNEVVWYSNGTFVGDGKTSFEDYAFKDDAARENWGGTWRTPTNAEWAKLLNTDNYRWSWTTDYRGTAISGYVVTSRVPGYEGNQIFLPAAGCYIGINHASAGEWPYGFYWSSTLLTGSTPSAYYVQFNGSSVISTYQTRYVGSSVRAVSE